MAADTDATGLAERAVIADVLHEAYCCTGTPRNGKGRVPQCLDVAEAILTVLRARTGMTGRATGERSDTVKVPDNEDEAAMMALIGHAWLRDHAPHRLRKVQSADAALSGERSESVEALREVTDALEELKEVVRKSEKLNGPEYNDIGYRVLKAVQRGRAALRTTAPAGEGESK